MEGIQNLNLQSVEQSLDKIYTFLVPCLPLANAHATDFITNSYWDTLIPAGIQEQLLTLSREELANLPSAVLERTKPCDVEDNDSKTKEPSCYAKKSLNSTLNDNDLKQAEIFETDVNDEKHDSQKGISNSEENKIPYTNIDDFLHDAHQNTIETKRLAISPHDLICGMGGEKEEMFVGTYMNQKKCHEVEIMSKICATLAQCFCCQMIIDFGSGKGYLGNHLSLQYQLPVLGIDAASINTQSAKKRNTVLDKQWSSLSRNKQLEAGGKKLTKKEKKKLKLSGQNKPIVEVEAKRYNEYINGTEVNNDKDNVTEDGDIVEAKAVIKLDPTEAASDLSKMNISETDIGRSENKFIPCTTFIDKETNFINLAKFNFPELFKENIKAKAKHEQCLNDDNCNDKRDRTSEITVSNISSQTTTIWCTTCDRKSNDDKYLTSDNADVSKADDDDKADIRNTLENKSVASVISDSQVDIRKAVDNITDENNPDVSKHGKIDGKDAGIGSATHKDKSDVNNEFPMMLIGLHTCGNLASTSMEVFVHSDHLKVLCNVGCCYHLIHEQYLDEDNGSLESGFPLSTFLKKRIFKLGNTARNLASQSLHRISDFDKLQGERFYPRALLEVLIQDVCSGNIEMKGLRKLEQKCQTTQEYLRRACDKLGISDKVSDDMIEAYIRKYSDDKHKLAAFFQLKTALAPCIESLIILDRVCYLLEQDQIKNVFLVKMFDPIKSPRCYGIIAVK